MLTVCSSKIEILSYFNFFLVAGREPVIAKANFHLNGLHAFNNEDNQYFTSDQTCLHYSLFKRSTDWTNSRPKWHGEYKFCSFWIT